MKRIILIFITIIFLSCQKGNEPTPTTTQTTTNPTNPNGNTPVVSHPVITLTTQGDLVSGSDVTLITTITNLPIDSIVQVSLFDGTKTVVLTSPYQSTTQNIPSGTYNYTVTLTITGGSTTSQNITLVVTPSVSEIILNKLRPFMGQNGVNNRMVFLSLVNNPNSLGLTFLMNGNIPMGGDMITGGTPNDPLNNTFWKGYYTYGTWSIEPSGQLKITSIGYLSNTNVKQEGFGTQTTFYDLTFDENGDGFLLVSPTNSFVIYKQ